MRFKLNTLITKHKHRHRHRPIILPSIIQTPLIIYYDEQYYKQLQFTKNIRHNIKTFK